MNVSTNDIFTIVKPRYNVGSFHIFSKLDHFDQIIGKREGERLVRSLKEGDSEQFIFRVFGGPMGRFESILKEIIISRYKGILEDVSEDWNVRKKKLEHLAEMLRRIDEAYPDLK